MPHVTFVPMTGFRVREAEMLELGMALPGFANRAKALAELPALGVLTLAGLNPEAWTCRYQAASECSDRIIESIVGESPDLVVISALTASVLEAYELSDRIRQTGVPVVMGGLHVSCCPDEALRHCDSVMIGRGEGCWRRMLADVEQQQLQPRYESPRHQLPTWPMPRFDLLPADVGRFTLQTQTGCPFSCGFCGASRLISRFYEKPVENIRWELEEICRLRSRPLLELADDNTFAGDRDADELLSVLQDSGARWFTESDWRIGERPELLDRLAAAGCAQVLAGLESLVFRYPGMGRKAAEMERMMNAVQAIQEAGVAVNGCFIVGAEGETRASLDRLTQFLLECPLAEIQVTLQTPFPGTHLYADLKRQGRLLPDRDWSSYTLFDVTYQPDRMSVEELETGFRDVLKAVFGESATKRRQGIRREVMRRARELRRLC